MKILSAAAITLGLSLFAGAAIAETLEMPVGSQSRTGIDRLPVNGQMTSDVLNLLGEPATRRGPVGDPPITAWDYGEFVVYFEYDVVLHTVVKPR